jgi:CheY-like chemotaxis protein
MQEFSLRTTCNTIIKEFNRGVNNGNIIRISIDIELPDNVSGSPVRFRKIIERLSCYLSDKLVNGIITLSLSGKVISEKAELILFTFFARDSTVLEALDPHKKNKLLSDLIPISTELEVDVRFKIIDHGIQLTLRMPLYEQIATPIKQTHPLSEKHVLLAEDNDINAMVFISFMEEWGIQTLHVLDGQAAVNQFMKSQFDLILMDINMPVMNGIEAILEIRKMDKAIPILMLTASTMELDILSGLQAGANGYILKPVSSSHLCELLSHHLT